MYNQYGPKIRILSESCEHKQDFLLFTMTIVTSNITGAQIYLGVQRMIAANIREKRGSFTNSTEHK